MELQRVFRLFLTVALLAIAVETACCDVAHRCSSFVIAENNIDSEPLDLEEDPDPALAIPVAPDTPTNSTVQLSLSVTAGGGNNTAKLARAPPASA